MYNCKYMYYCTSIATVSASGMSNFNEIVQEAKKAIREMNGATIAGQEIKVGKSWKPPELAKFG